MSIKTRSPALGRRLGVVMDPIASIHAEKDSTLAMLLEAQARDWQIYYFEQRDLSVQNGVAYGDAARLRVKSATSDWFSLQEKQRMPLAELDIILMRKDPPFNRQYIYTTYILELAEQQGVLVANRPQALRDCNEKFFATHFPHCTPSTLVAQTKEQLFAFWREHKDIVCKPLSGMGGAQVFRLRDGDANATAIFDILTRDEQIYVMAQSFIPDIAKGDKRILLINGEPLPYALARVPQGKEWRGNLALGAKGIVQPLSERDRFICAQVGPDCAKRGLYFVGLDVIGDYLTEINVTSPTGIREIDKGANINVSAMLMDFFAAKLMQH
jgi:glutathione synthase